MLTLTVPLARFSLDELYSFENKLRRARVSFKRESIPGSEVYLIRSNTVKAVKIWQESTKVWLIRRKTGISYRAGLMKD